MSKRLVCIQIKEDSKYVENTHLCISQTELLKIQKANSNINDLKLFYEVIYMLKENYKLLLEYMKENEKEIKQNPIDINNKRYLEINRQIFNIVSSFNVINEHIHYLLKKDEEYEEKKKEQKKPQKQKNIENLSEGEKKYEQYMDNYIRPHYDSHFEYRFLYQMRNHVNHQKLAITDSEFNFNFSKYTDKFFVAKESLLENHIIKKAIREEIDKKFDDKIDIFEIIKKGVPDFINTVLKYIQTKADSIQDDINLIKEYKRKLRRNIRGKINEDCLIYGICDTAVNKLTDYFPISFIQRYENNDEYKDIL